MNSPLFVFSSLGGLLFGADPEPGDCAGWEPRFELVLHPSERGVFYPTEIIELEVWILEVCPYASPGQEAYLHSGNLALIEECLEEDPECLYGKRAPAWSFVGPPTGAGCPMSFPCEADSAEERWGQLRVLFLGAGVGCEQPIGIPADGRVFLGTLEQTPEMRFDFSWPWSRRVLVGDTRDAGRCRATEEARFLVEPVSPNLYIQPRDSDPIEIRVVERPFIRGDANDDGALDVSDPIFVLGVLFGEHYGIFQCAHAGDADDNNLHEITDAVFLLLFLFNGGEPPVAPFPDPGYDATPTSSKPDLVGCFAGVFP